VSTATGIVEARGAESQAPVSPFAFVLLDAVGGTEQVIDAFGAGAAVAALADEDVRAVIESILARDSRHAQMDLGDVKLTVEAASDAEGGRHALVMYLVNEPDPLGATLERTAVIASLKDAEGRYRRVSQGYCEQFATTAEQVIGHTDDELAPGETIDGPRIAEGAAVAAEPAQFEYIVGAYNNRPALTVLRFPVLDASGQRVGLCAVAAPSTDARLARDECVRLMRLERWSRLDPAAVRAEMCAEWGVAVAEPAPVGSGSARRAEEPVSLSVVSESRARAVAPSRTGSDAVASPPADPDPAILAERDRALAERDAVAAERDALAAERDAATAQRDAVVAELDAATAQRDAVAAELDAATAQRDAVAAELDAATAQRDAVAAEREAVAAEREAVAAERDAAAAERDAAAAERDAAVEELAGMRLRSESLGAELTSLREGLDAQVGSAEHESMARREAEAALHVAQERAARAESERGETQGELDRVRAGYEHVSAELARVTGELSAAAAEYDASTSDHAHQVAELARLAIERDLAVAERDAMVAERDAAVVERDAMVVERDAIAAERDAVAAERDAAVAERDAAVAERDAVAAERYAMAAERDAAVVEGRAAVAERDGALEERAAAVAQRDGALEARDAAVAERDVAVAQRDSTAAERDQIAADRDAMAAERDAIAAERDAMAAERDAAVSDRDAAAAERDAAVSDRGAAAAERDAAVSERDSAMAERDRLVAEQVQVAAERGLVTSERDQVTDELSRVNHERDRLVVELAALKEHLQAAQQQIAELMAPPAPAEPVVVRPPDGSGPRWGADVHHAAAAALARSSEWMTGLRDAVKSLGSMGGWDAICTWMPVDRRPVLRCSAAWTETSGDLAGFETSTWQQSQPLTGSALGKAFNAPGATWCTDLTEDRRMIEVACHGMQTALLVPIRDGSRTVAVLEFLSRVSIGADTELSVPIESLALLLGHLWHLERAGAVPHWRLGRV
jgi:uncharacterized protein (DUF3084 family)